MKYALVVDDTKNIRILLSKSLKLEGFTVYTAKDSFEALNLIDQFKFHIAFIDIKMPGMSGIALLEEISAKNISFPIIIMTAFGTIKNAVKATKLGANAYLQKPFSPSTIKKTLEEVLGVNYNSKPKSIDINIKSSEILNKAPLKASSYLELSHYLSLIEEENLSLLFKEFSIKLSEFEDKNYV